MHSLSGDCHALRRESLEIDNPIDVGSQPSLRTDARTRDDDAGIKVYAFLALLSEILLIPYDM